MTFEELKDKAHSLPLKPGVYLMMDKSGTVIYVGKAKALKNRVSSYFQDQASHTEKTRAMVAQIDHFDTIIAGSEFEALVLENSLIKRHKPRYNILLKDDKGYPYIRLSAKDPYPRFSMAGRMQDDGARYFGPFGGRHDTQTILDALRGALKLPDCGRRFPRDIGKERPCLNYHMGKCDGYCRPEAEKARHDQAIDQAMAAVPMMTMILLNSPRLFGSTGEKALLDACLHPHYDWNCPNAYISAFDMETEEGQGYYAAFVSFLVERYTRPDGKYGRAVGAIISNEVNSQYIWGNAGDMPVEAYTREYAQALRLAWLCGQRFCRHFRVYISLDQFWCGTNFDPSQKTRYYSGRRMLELLAEYGRAEGDFPWNVAYHPYPEDLRWPDFWHDRAPDFTFSTPKITFKNMEVLEAFLSQKAFLYKGAPRRVIFSEQGFNSQNGPMQALTERMAAAGYVLAYMKARKMKTVDLFTHHATVDNPHEFGLNLGMFRYDPSAPHHLGEPKPIFASFEAMETEGEAEAVQKARAFIGPELFDFLLDPPLLYGERDTSQDDAFGN